MASMPRVLLHKSRILPVGHTSVPDPLLKKEDLAMAQSLREQGQEIAVCTYGPSEPDGTGFVQYFFWNHRVPDEALLLMRADPHGAFWRLGVKAVDGCPSNLAEAVKVSKAATAAIMESP